MLLAAKGWTVLGGSILLVDDGYFMHDQLMFNSGNGDHGLSVANKRS